MKRRHRFLVNSHLRAEAGDVNFRLVDLFQNLSFWRAFAISMGATMVVVALVWMVWSHFNALAMRTAREVYLNAEVDEHALHLQTWLQASGQHLRIAARTTSIREFQENRIGAQMQLRHLGEEISSLIQIRILDLSGHEVIRIDRVGHRVLASPEGQLQDKSGRYYFEAAQSLQSGEIYVSKLDLNVEHGQIEVPWMPTERLLTPIMGQNGAKIGYLAFNIDMHSPLSRYGAVGVRGSNIAITNDDGFWLGGVDRAKLWGDMRSTGISLAAEHPGLWEIIQRAGQKGQFEYHGSLYAFRHLPLNDLVVRDGAAKADSMSNGVLIYGSSPLEGWFGDFGLGDGISLFMILIFATFPSGVIGYLFMRRNVARSQHLQIEEHLVGIQRMAALGRIVAGVAHELRTPIGNVRTVVSALSEDIKAFRKSIPDDPDASPDRASLEEFVETLETGSRIAERNVERAVDLVRHFRQTAVDQNNEQRRKFDMGAVISELLATLRPQYAKRGVTLKTDFAGPVMVENFSSVIDQLVLSLVNNAMTHAFDAETGGTIIVRARSLPNDNVLLEVADDGKGIPKDIQSMIFEPFWTTRRGSGGTGMGLSIVVSIVNRVLAGEIDVISTPGKGATFRVIMPARAPNESSVKSSIFEADVTASGGSFDGS